MGPLFIKLPGNFCGKSDLLHHLASVIMSKSISNEAFSAITEGSASICFPKGQVFYNPVQQFNRDLSIAVISTFLKYNTGRQTDSNKIPTIFEGLSASGLRSIRYAKEIPNVKIIANDLDPFAVKTIMRNIEQNSNNDLDLHEIISTSAGDANTVMYDLRRTRTELLVIDLDPYGSAVPFLDSAVQAIADGGLLCITCTDLAVLCAGHPETCFGKYGGLPLKGDACHEAVFHFTIRCIFLFRLSGWCCKR